MSESALAAWGRILQAMPQAQLWLRNDAVGDGEARRRLMERLSRAGIAASRVTLSGHIAGRQEYLAAYSAVDIILDTFPHPGATTTCEALWMGVPTLTLARGCALGIIGASLLTCAGLNDWVAWSEDEYVALALRQASDTAGLARLGTRLRQQVAGTPLFDAALFAPQLEVALMQIWQCKMNRTLPVAGGAARSAAPGAN